MTLDRLAAIARFQTTRDDAFARRCCVRCEAQVDDDWTTLDLREWEISALCGSCFDAITEPDE